MEQRVTLGLAAAAGLVAGATAPQATGTRPFDVVLCGAIAALVVIATAHARRWTWVWLAAVAAAGAIGGDWILVAALGVGAAAVGVTSRANQQAVGAAVGTCSGIALFHLDTSLPSRLPTLIAAVAVAPVMWSAYSLLKRRQKRVVNRVLLTATVFCVVALAGLAISAVQARSQLDDGVSASRAALEALRSGDQAAAGALFTEAEASFSAAADSLTSPWALPGRAVPVAGQHAIAAVAVAESGRDLAAQAAETATIAPYGELRATDGSIDLELVRRMQQPVDDSAAQLDHAAGRLAAVESPWLLPAVSGPLTEFAGEIDDTLPDAELAAATLHALPPLLGAEGPRNYFIAFANPAESRFGGGFIGAYGLLTAVDGKVTLTRSGPVADLNNAPGADNRALSDMRTWQERYARYHPTRFLQNLTASPDMASNAEAIRQLYPQAGGQPIDGVIYVDPEGLAALLELTGPVEVPELGRTLDAATVADYLTKGQYLEANSDEGASDAALVDASQATFEALTSRELPTPRTLGKVLGPAVAGGHLAFTTFDEDSQAFLDRLGTTGRFVSRENTDWMSLRMANLGPNKIDAYLEQDVEYDVSYDPATGFMEATLTATITNTADPASLPPYVVANNDNQPAGTAQLYLALFTPHRLTSASIDSAAAPAETQRELGGQVHTVKLAVPPNGGTSQVVFRLDGRLGDGGPYRLSIDHQAVVNDPSYSVRATALDGWVPVAERGRWEISGTDVSGSFVLTQDERLSATFERED